MEDQKTTRPLKYFEVAIPQKYCTAWLNKHNWEEKEGEFYDKILKKFVSLEEAVITQMIREPAPDSLT